MINGPSPYAVKVLRALLKRPMRIPEIASETRLHYRTVQAQITALREARAIRVVRREWVNFGGSWAVYEPVVERL